MPISTAWKLSEQARKSGLPAGVFSGGNHQKYSEVSGRIISIVRKYAPLVEQASIDEAYIDLSFSENYEKAEKIARAIKAEIKKKEKLSCSVGMGR